MFSTIAPESQSADRGKKKKIQLKLASVWNQFSTSYAQTYLIIKTRKNHHQTCFVSYDWLPSPTKSFYPNSTYLVIGPICFLPGFSPPAWIGSYPCLFAYGTKRIGSFGFMSNVMIYESAVNITSRNKVVVLSKCNVLFIFYCDVFGWLWWNKKIQTSKKYKMW